MTKNKRIQHERMHIGKAYYGFDYELDYSQLLPLTIIELSIFAETCKYSGKNSNGKSRNRKFWEYLKTAYNAEKDIREKLGLPF